MAFQTANNPGGGIASNGETEPVEFVPINGAGAITIGGAWFPGATEATQHGGVNAPTKRTESGYDYTTRVNREARKATISGWVTSEGLDRLQRLRTQPEPFAVAADHVLMQRATLTDLSETASGDTAKGAYEVTVKVKEVFRARSGTSTVQALPSSGKKTGSHFNPDAGNYIWKDPHAEGGGYTTTELTMDILDAFPTPDWIIGGPESNGEKTSGSKMAETEENG